MPHDVLRTPSVTATKERKRESNALEQVDGAVAQTLASGDGRDVLPASRPEVPGDDDEGEHDARTHYE